MADSFLKIRGGSSFYAYFRLGKVQLKIGLPRGARKGVIIGPCRVSHRVRKEQSKGLP